MKSLQNIFDKKKFLHEKSSGFNVDDKTIFHLFSQVILEEYGQMGKKSIIPVHYKEKTLFVTFSQSLWAQEVWMNRAHLTKTLNDKIGKVVVYKIKAQH